MDALEWLEGWVDENITEPGFRDKKSAIQNEAAACAAGAKKAGISITDLKDAAGGDLESYLLDRQNELTDAEVKRLADKDD